MEAAFGGEIFDFVATGRLSENVTRLYFKKLMTAIKIMHANGVYHRDLKPENLLLNEQLELKIEGFEFSIHKDKLNGNDRSTEIVGTRAYMSPECLTQ